MKSLTLFSAMSITLLAAFTTGDSPKVKDYLSVPGPLAFNKGSYSLSWSSHPSATYYKQEYLPAGQTSDKYTSMILLEVATGDFTLADLVKSKTAELDQRKKTDQTTNYSVIQNPTTGEYMLDFVISQGTGAVGIVEWNVYRYVKLKDKAGAKGVQLISYSKRAYGDAGTAFLKQLKTTRPTDINAMATYKVPEVKQ
jgi:hypothetical protein